MHAVSVEVVLQKASKASPLAWWLDDVVPGTPRGKPDPRVHYTIRAARQAMDRLWTGYFFAAFTIRYDIENNTSKNTILRWIYSGGQREVDFQKYLQHKEKDKRQRNRKKAAILEQSPEFWKTFTMVTPLIMAEMAASVLFELLVAIFSFSIALYTLVIGIFYQGAAIKPLLTASFGQIMPMLLLIVIALTAVEVGTIKNFRRIEIEIEIEIKKHPALLHNTTRGGPGPERDTSARPPRHCWLWHKGRLNDQMDDIKENDDNRTRRGEKEAPKE
ncbi:hypothetical protein ACKAV7_004660 [Fusarium commune]